MEPSLFSYLHEQAITVPPSMTSKSARSYIMQGNQQSSFQSFKKELYFSLEFNLNYLHSSG